MAIHLKLMTVFFAIGLFTGCTSKTKNSPEEDANTITLASVKLTNLYGEEIDMDDFKNKTVFINFWATWCKPCIQEMPTIEKAQEQLQDKNIVFLLASNESVEQIRTFKEKREFQFRYVQVQTWRRCTFRRYQRLIFLTQKENWLFLRRDFELGIPPKI